MAPKGRLDLPLCVSSGQVFRWEELADGSWLGVDGWKWYRVALPTALGSLGNGENDRFVVESNGTPEDFRCLFRLDWDAGQVERQILERGPELGPYMAALHGLRVMCPSSPTETFFSFLCTANNNMPRIKSMIRKLANYGPVIGEVSGRPAHRFPSAEMIARIPESELRATGFGYRAATITEAARQIMELGGAPGRAEKSGARPPHSKAEKSGVGSRGLKTERTKFDASECGWILSLQGLPYERAHEQLVGIKGIGHKLADCICLFGLDKTEAVPIDTHLWQAVTRLYFPDWREKAITDQRYRQASQHMRDRFGELAGWAHQYLFYENVLNWRARRRADGL